MANQQESVQESVQGLTYDHQYKFFLDYAKETSKTKQIVETLDSDGSGNQFVLAYHMAHNKLEIRNCNDYVRLRQRTNGQPFYKFSAKGMEKFCKV